MTIPAKTIAVVEDDPRLSEHLCALLSHQHWHARPFRRAAQFFAAARRAAFDAVLLDLHLPDLSASQLLSRLPGEMRPRTIALTGRMDDWIVQESFDAGLADFLLKPCRILELKCRLLRVFEHTHRCAPERPEAPMGGLPLDRLTHRERLCLEHLLARANAVVSREELMWKLCRLDERISSRRVDTYVSRIRQKLGLQAHSAYRLTSVYGCGYRLETRP